MIYIKPLSSFLSKTFLKTKWTDKYIILSQLRRFLEIIIQYLWNPARYGKATKKPKIVEPNSYYDFYIILSYLLCKCLGLNYLCHSSTGEARSCSINTVVFCWTSWLLDWIGLGPMQWKSCLREILNHSTCADNSKEKREEKIKWGKIKVTILK